MSKKNKHGSQFPKPNSPSTPAVTPAPVATVPNPRQPRNEAIAILNENGTGGRKNTAPVFSSGQFLFANQVGLLYVI